MKKFLLISFLLCGIVISGCTKGLSKNELFEKKQECMSLFETEIKQTFETETNSYSVIDNFYSPKLNTCIVGFTDHVFEDNKNNYHLRNALEKSNITINSGGIEFEGYNYDNYKKLIKELKGE